MSVESIHNPNAPEIDALLSEKRDDILRLAAERGATNVRVFGSVARVEATTDSDVDFLVDMPIEHSLWDRLELRCGLEQLLSRNVDAATERVLKPRVRERVWRDIVLL